MGISVIVTIDREDEDLAWLICKRTFSWRFDRCFMLIYIYFLSFPLFPILGSDFPLMDASWDKSWTLLHLV